ncbi:uncharacterized protein G2W53_022978 [Senna tora]|uniref:Reverse transcriptase zinc-binding domain-containing protein n=1 Tax=Senna tora TaxID=362788 RepID=A0A834TV96_9FABA|nr:uncharacterized protein G2W53_022978 [Senna tora]
MTWRSLFAGKTLILPDLIRCIGNGRTTKVWTDAWVPGNFPYTIQRPRAVMDGVNVVSDLMDGAGNWRSDILNYLFEAEISEKIQGIELNCHQFDDKWVWLGDAKGLFTVSTCYKYYMARHWEEINLLPHLQGRVGSGFWKHLWKAPVLPKYKAFLWRACLGILPTSAALARRGVEVEDKCIWCGSEEENAFHVLVECPVMQRFWRRSRFDFSSSRWHGSLVEWLDVEGLTWGREQWCLCTIALYHLWEARNRKKFTSELVNIDQLWGKVTLRWEEIQEARRNDIMEETAMELCKWEKPTGAAMKMNSDAGTMPSGGGIVGGVIRDRDGYCNGAFTERYDCSSNPMVLEAVAIRSGMEFAISLGIEELIVETGAKLVLEFLSSSETQISPLLQVFSFAKDSMPVTRWVDSVPLYLADAIRFDI